MWEGGGLWLYWGCTCFFMQDWAHLCRPTPPAMDLRTTPHLSLGPTLSSESGQYLLKIQGADPGPYGRVSSLKEDACGHGSWEAQLG